MRFAAFGILSLALALPLAGQESRATIVGTVTDSSGALVVGAKVRTTLVAAGTVVSSVTNEQGYYEVPYLLPGVYRVEVELQGFKKAVRESIELRVSDRMSLDFALEVGELAESVVVTGETPMLESQTASIGMIMDERRVAVLPIVGGNPFYLIRLSPGVISSGGRYAGNSIDQGAATDVIVNGTRSGSSEAMLDGAPNMAERNQVFSPPQDVVQEFKTHTATFDASLGHAAGAVTNVSIKSGTNSLHGTGYHFDSRWRAVPWHTNLFIYDPNTGPITEEKKQRAITGWLHQHWGTSLSGPLRLPKIYDGRNRTFWTFAYEGLYIRRNLSGTYTVPTVAQRKGDFSDLLKLGSRYQIYDPATIQPAAQAGRFSRLPLPGNLVPASRIDPMALKFLPYWPEPNQPGTADFRQNFFRTRNIDRDNRNMIGRLDHVLTQDHRIFVRLNSAQHNNKEDTLPSIASGTLLDRTGYGMGLDDVYVFGPQLLLNLRYGLTYQQPWTSRASQGFDVASLGFPASLMDEIRRKNNLAGIAFPQITVDGLQQLGDNGGSTSTIYYHTFGGTLTKVHGEHSMKIGAEYRLMRENGYGYGNVAPRVDFSTGWTRGPLDNSPAAPIGQGFAALLFGRPTGGNININASRAEQSGYTSFFFQDDWRVTSRLTVNLGLRYEYESPTTERFNRTIRDFDFTTPSPISAAALANYAKAPIAQVPVASFKTAGGLRFAGAGGGPRELWSGDRNNFAPRAGLAYRLGSHTVIRSGYGVFFDVLGIDRQDVNQGGFSQATNLIPSLDNGLTFRASLSNPFPDGLQTPAGASAGIATFLGRGLSFFNSKPLNPYMQRWTFSVQHQLPWRVLIESSYVDNRGTKLGVSREVNPVPAAYLSTLPERDQKTIDFLGEQVTNPFYGIPDFTGSGLGNVRTGRSQLLRPYPQFQGISTTEPAGYSYFHSLQFSAEKRLSSGVNFQMAWTWSKFMAADSFLNNSDPVPYRVISDQDFTHRFVLSGIYELPFGQGKKIAGGAPRWLDSAIGGWQLQGWFEGQTGDVLGFGNAIFRGDLKDVPLPVSQRRSERWFNVDAGFERDNSKALASNIQTFPPRFSGVRADGINNFDLSLFKHFRIREGLKAQFRLETFNSLNHVQFSNPNTSPTSTAFGTLTGEKGHGQRQITLAIKLIF
ncbi:MAG: TonB-dependent receptor [Acidobacteria bacterium]|nr:TonB-dependent receptor [Acidobacteriota bacterium]